MFRRIFAAALGAGIGVGVLIAALQHVALVPMILEAEKYESGAVARRNTSTARCRHSPACVAALLVTEAKAHDQADAPMVAEDLPWRPVFTWIATTLTSVGFALAAGRRIRGQRPRGRRTRRLAVGNCRALLRSRWRPPSACRPSCRDRWRPNFSPANRGGSEPPWRRPRRIGLHAVRPRLLGDSGRRRASRCAACHWRAASAGRRGPRSARARGGVRGALARSQRRVLGVARLGDRGALRPFRPRRRDLTARRLRTLVLGGARSGKSRYAESLIAALPPPWRYVATAQAGDEEMAARIAAHRARRGAEWRTVEAPRDLAAALAACGRIGPVLVDCLTLWLSNLMLAEADIDAEVERLETALAATRRTGGAGRQRGRLRHRARTIRSAAASATAGHSQPTPRRARRPGRAHGRRPAARREGAGRKRHDRNDRQGRSRAPPRQDGEAQGRAGRRGGGKDDREGSAHRPHRPRQGQVDRRLRPRACACSGAATASASCSSSRARGIPASATRSSASAIRSRWHTMGEGFTWETQDRARDVAAAERAWAKARELMADPSYPARRSRRTQHRAALRLSRSRRGGCRARGAPRRPARRRHRPQRQAGADRRRRPRHRDDAGEAPLRRRREGAAGHRVLKHAGARAHVPGHGLGRRQVADRRRARARLRRARPRACARSSRRTCRTTPR